MVVANGGGGRVVHDTGGDARAGVVRWPSSLGSLGQPTTAAIIPFFAPANAPPFAPCPNVQLCFKCEPSSRAVPGGFAR